MQVETNTVVLRTGWVAISLMILLILGYILVS